MDKIPTPNELAGRHAAALDEWFEKTNWVQKATFPFNVLGLHRADVMRKEIERLRARLTAEKAVGLSDADVKRLKDTIVGLRDGWATRATADAALALMESLRSTAVMAGSRDRDIFAICDAYESGMGHGMEHDGHKSGAMFENREHGEAYEIGYKEGEERAAYKKLKPPPNIRLAAMGAAGLSDDPFMWAIMGPGGKVHFDEMCVSGSPGDLSETVYYLNDEQETGDYSVVPVYTRPTASGAGDLAQDRIMAEAYKVWPNAVWNDGLVDHTMRFARAVLALRPTANGTEGQKDGEA